MVPVVGGEITRLPADAKWWIDHRDDVGYSRLFQLHFGLPEEGAGRAYRVIEDHLNYNAQLGAMGEPESRAIEASAYRDLAHSAGSEEKAREILSAFGLGVEHA